MKTVVIIPCHNQADSVNVAQRFLDRQSVRPDRVLIVDDHSDNNPCDFDAYDFTLVQNSTERGRCNTRNHAITWARENAYDLLIFMDGDTVPQHLDYIKAYKDAILKSPYGVPLPHRRQAIFGTRQHIFRPVNMKDFSYDFTYECIPITNLPSDLLTVNMGNCGEIKDPTDLRIVSGAISKFNDKNTDTITKLAILTTGLVTWSCNFAITREALDSLVNFRLLHFGNADYFDSKTFKDMWGGEDNIFGMDLIGADVDIKTSDIASVYHFMHERAENNLFDYMREIPIRQERYYKIRKLVEDREAAKTREEQLVREMHDVEV